MTDDRPPAWKLLVLAYVDGELDAAKRREVEAWIAENSEVAELVRELRETGKGGPFRDTAPPAPRADDLTRSGEQILARLRPVRRRRRLMPAILSGAVAAMAAILYVACPPDHRCEIASAPTSAVPKAEPVDPLAEYDDLPIATPGEARVSSIRGDVAPVFVACDDLLPEVLELATAEEMQIQKTGRSALSMPGPNDVPMIFQVQTRAK